MMKKEKLMLMVVAVVVMGVSGVNAAPVWTVDLQGRDFLGGGLPYGQTGPIDFVVPGLTFNYFEVQGVTGTQGSAFTEGPVSLGLLAEDGVDSGVLFTVDSPDNTLFGWCNAGDGSFSGDWLYVMPSDADGGWTTGSANPLSWSITGLLANQQYEVKMHHSATSSSRGIDFTANGDTLTVVGSGGIRVGSMFVTTDANGDITGTAATSGTLSQGNWSGMQIYEIPEPATIALIGLGGLLIRRRRK